MMEKALANVGWSHLTTHSLRHPFESLQFMQGRDLHGSATDTLLGRLCLRVGRIRIRPTSIPLIMARAILLRRDAPGKEWIEG
jgi:hypothetical protein